MSSQPLLNPKIDQILKRVPQFNNCTSTGPLLNPAWPNQESSLSRQSTVLPAKLQKFDESKAKRAIQQSRQIRMKSTVSSGLNHQISNVSKIDSRDKLPGSKQKDLKTESTAISKKRSEMTSQMAKGSGKGRFCQEKFEERKMKSRQKGKQKIIRTISHQMPNSEIFQGAYFLLEVNAHHQYQFCVRRLGQLSKLFQKIYLQIGCIRGSEIIKIHPLVVTKKLSLHHFIVLEAGRYLVHAHIEGNTANQTKLTVNYSVDEDSQNKPFISFQNSVVNLDLLQTFNRHKDNLVFEMEKVQQKIASSLSKHSQTIDYDQPCEAIDKCNSFVQTMTTCPTHEAETQTDIGISSIYTKKQQDGGKSKYQNPESFLKLDSEVSLNSEENEQIQNFVSRYSELNDSEASPQKKQSTNKNWEKNSPICSQSRSKEEDRSQLRPFTRKNKVNHHQEETPSLMLEEFLVPKNKQQNQQYIRSKSSLLQSNERTISLTLAEGLASKSESIDLEYSESTILNQNQGGISGDKFSPRTLNILTQYHDE